MRRDDDGKQPVDLGPRQGGGRLVHEDQSRLCREPTCNGDDLALRHGEVGDNGIEVEIEVEALEHVARDLAHARPCAPVSAVVEMVLDRNVLRDRKVGKKGQVLEDHLDAERLCMRWIQRETVWPSISIVPALG